MNRDDSHPYFVTIVFFFITINACFFLAFPIPNRRGKERCATGGGDGGRLSVRGTRKILTEWCLLGKALIRVYPRMICMHHPRKIKRDRGKAGRVRSGTLMFPVNIYIHVFLTVPRNPSRCREYFSRLHVSSNSPNVEERFL